jgi:hypothetical protein
MAHSPRSMLTDIPSGSGSMTFPANGRIALSRHTAGRNEHAVSCLSPWFMAPFHTNLSVGFQGMYSQCTLQVKSQVPNKIFPFVMVI